MRCQRQLTAAAAPAPGSPSRLRSMLSTRIDWSQLWYPGPQRAFSADEMAAAGSEGPSPTLLAMVGINLALIAFLLLQMAPASETARLLGLMVPLTLAGVAGARWLWWRPWRGPLMLTTLAGLALTVLMLLGLRWRLPDRDDRAWLNIVVVAWGSTTPVLLWFLVIWRAHQIESRLSEQAEREKAIEMARRLAAAQLEPHFLFNTLASLQHWVDTKDDRAAPLLAALTGYLRATLPMFKRPTLALHEELLAVERYLQVMQARMGQRLTWQIDVAPTLRDLPLPPGRAADPGGKRRPARPGSPTGGRRSALERADPGPSGPHRRGGQRSGSGRRCCRRRGAEQRSPAPALGLRRRRTAGAAGRPPAGCLGSP